MSSFSQRIALSLIGWSFLVAGCELLLPTDRDRLTTDSGGATTGAGGAAASCPGTLLSCGENCVDVRFDRSNCGKCAGVCGKEEVCSQGACGLECKGGTLKCEVTAIDDPGGPALPLCADPKVDSAHCGACGNACSADQICSNGECADDCNGGTTKCEGQSGAICVNFTNDEGHCGSCDKACSAHPGNGWA